MTKLIRFLRRILPVSRRRARLRSMVLFEKLEPCLLMSGAPLHMVLLDGALSNVAMLRNAVSSGAIVISYDRQKMSAEMVLNQAVQEAIDRHSTIGSLTLLSHGTA